jgi:hypothetical protein
VAVGICHNVFWTEPKRGGPFYAHVRYVAPPLPRSSCCSVLSSFAAMVALEVLVQETASINSIPQSVLSQQPGAAFILVCAAL